jgi:hypothetical protein
MVLNQRMKIAVRWMSRSKAAWIMIVAVFDELGAAAA